MNRFQSNLNIGIHSNPGSMLEYIFFFLTVTAFLNETVVAEAKLKVTKSKGNLQSPH